MSEFSIDKLQLLSVANIKLRLYDDLSIEKNKRLIFIYTPPKVGSTSLVSSFRICASKKCTILHIHNEKMLDILCGIKDVSINDARTHGRLNRLVILKGGWHFSFPGGVKRIASKLDSYGHQELNVPEVVNNIQDIVSSNRDMRGRAIKYRKSNRRLPDYLLQNLEDYGEMLL